MWITIGLIGKEDSVRLYVTKKNKVMHVSGNQSTQNFVTLIKTILDSATLSSTTARKKARSLLGHLVKTSSNLSMQLEKSPSKGVVVRITDEESNVLFSNADCCFIRDFRQSSRSPVTRSTRATTSATKDDRKTNQNQIVTPYKGSNTIEEERELQALATACTPWVESDGKLEDIKEAFATQKAIIDLIGSNDQIKLVNKRIEKMIRMADEWSTIRPEWFVGSVENIRQELDYQAELIHRLLIASDSSIESKE